MGGHNAMAAHFVPAPISNIKSPYVKANSSVFYTRMSGQRLYVKSSFPAPMPITAALFDISGKRIALQTGQKEILFDISNVARGTYVVQVKNAGITRAGKTVVSGEK
jgi:hypothetical protein